MTLIGRETAAVRRFVSQTVRASRAPSETLDSTWTLPLTNCAELAKHCGLTDVDIPVMPGEVPHM